MKASQNRSPKLFDQMLQELRTPGYALRTERTYIDWERSDSRVWFTRGWATDYHYSDGLRFSITLISTHQISLLSEKNIYLPSGEI